MSLVLADKCFKIKCTEYGCKAELSRIQSFVSSKFPHYGVRTLQPEVRVWAGD